MRVVSLLPSATEIICGLGLQELLVGVSHECDYPSGVSCLPKVTQALIPHDVTSGEIDQIVRERIKTQQALYSLDRQVLRSVQPDLIVTQSICDVCAVSEQDVCDAIGELPGNPRIVNLQPKCFADVLQCIRQVGNAVGRDDHADSYVAALERRIDQVARRSETASDRPSVVMLEWIDPPFSAGHWNPELVELAGGREAIGVAGQRSVTTSWDQIVAADPEVMVIACCGFSAERARQDLPKPGGVVGWEKLRCVKSQRVHIVDGSAFFNRPGPRLVDSLEILANLLHPDVHPHHDP